MKLLTARCQHKSLHSSCKLPAYNTNASEVVKHGLHWVCGCVYSSLGTPSRELHLSPVHTFRSVLEHADDTQRYEYPPSNRPGGGEAATGTELDRVSIRRRG